MTTPLLGVSIHTAVTIDHEYIAQFFQAFAEVYKHLTSNPACTFFEVYQAQSPEKKGEISWVENWYPS